MKKIGVTLVLVAAVAIVSTLAIIRYRSESGSTEAESLAIQPEGASASEGAKDLDTTQEGSVDEVAAAVARRRGAKSPCMISMQNAANEGKYFFIFFHSSDDDQTQAMKKVFRSAMNSLAGEAIGAEVEISDPAEVVLVNKFNVRRAPMPLVLAIAPNGAITAGSPTQFTVDQLQNAIVSPCTEKSLKALQDRKLVFVCVQNAATESNDVAMAGVDSIRTDPGYSSSTEVVMLDPACPEESKFLMNLQVDPYTKEAVTVCLVPPGAAVARFTGATGKETIIAALVSSNSGCGPGGCGPGGCGK
jgi:hypothetical protein